jgi:hypothetical protein
MGSGIIRVAGIVQLGTVRDKTEDVHLRAHFDIPARFRNPVGKPETTLRSDRNVHEEINVVARLRLVTWYPDNVIAKVGVAAGVHKALVGAYLTIFALRRAGA